MRVISARINRSFSRKMFELYRLPWVLLSYSKSAQVETIYSIIFHIKTSVIFRVLLVIAISKVVSPGNS